MYAPESSRRGLRLLCVLLLSGMLSGCGSDPAAGPVPTKILVAVAELFAGACGSVTVSALDATGTAIAAPAAVTVDLAGKGSGTFFSDAACTTAVTSIPIAAGATSATVYYLNPFGEALTFSASDSAGKLTLGTLSVTVGVRLSRVSKALAETLCVVTDVGRPYCWGNNDSGQLGDGTKGTTPRPTPVLATPVTELALGNQHSCAITSGGAVRCWGSNGSFALGDNVITESLIPFDHPTITSGATKISAGNRFTCAIISGTTKCWGEDGNHQLGNNLTADSPTPVAVQGVPSGATALTSGMNHSCALLADQSLMCWGSNSSGQIGNNSSSDANTAISVATGVLAVDAGAVSTCAILADKSVSCWGGLNGVPVPVPVTGVTNAAAIAVGAQHACALIEGGTVKCWGSNNSGQLLQSDASLSAVDVALDGVATSISSAFFGTCVTLQDHSIQCWGSGSSGQLGRPTAFRAFTPTTIAGLSRAVSASPAVGAYHGCATSGSAVKCWGTGENGQLGNNHSFGSLTPVTVQGISSSDVALTAGLGHSCARVGTTAHCWGKNDYGQLGNNLGSSQIPAQVLGGNVLQVAAGEDHTCARVTGSDSILCWGRGDLGQLGNNSGGTSPTPVPIASPLTSPAQIAAGGQSTCAILNDATVHCWGALNSVTIHAAISGVAGATHLAVGPEHACAVVSGGVVKCWGENSHGELGNNSTTDSAAAVTTQVVGTAVEVALGRTHSCARLSDGTVQCWGSNITGQLGTSATTRQAQVPIAVVGLGGVATALVAGSDNTCAVVTGVGTRCWGSNTQGQLATVGGYIANPVRTTLPLLRGPATALVLDAEYAGATGCQPFLASVVTGTGSLASPVAADQTVNLSVGNSEGGFFSDAACSIPVTSTVIPAGARSGTVYYETLSSEELVVLGASDPGGVLTAGQTINQWVVP